MCYNKAHGLPEYRSETIFSSWGLLRCRVAVRYHVPRICFVNKMDRMGANFLRTRDMIEEMLGAVPLVMQLPIGSEDNFEGVFDLVGMKAITWNGEVQDCFDTLSDLP